jgi:hypothetical protein
MNERVRIGSLDKAEGHGFDPSGKDAMKPLGTLKNQISFSADRTPAPPLPAGGERPPQSDPQPAGGYQWRPVAVTEAAATVQDMRTLVSSAVEYMRSATHIVDITYQLRLETRNIIVKTAHLGTQGHTFAPIAQDIVQSTHLLKALTTPLTELANRFVWSLSSSMKTSRVMHLVGAAVAQSRMHSGADGGAADRCSRLEHATLHCRQQLSAAAGEARVTCVKLMQVVEELAKIGSMSAYAAELAKIETARLAQSTRGLAGTCDRMSELLAGLLGAINTVRQHAGETLDAVNVPGSEQV